MSLCLRQADLRDVDAIVAIKEALSLKLVGDAQRGGFLLGCSRKRYAAAVETGEVVVVEADGRIGGFAVTLSDERLRSSDMWQRRELIRWKGGEGEPAPEKPIAYFDQLALLPSQPRLYAVLLALAAVHKLAESGHIHLYATTLYQPVRNEAAIPLLRAIGGRPVGMVRETYEEVGDVVSELHHARLQEGLAAIENTPAGARIVASTLSLLR